MEECIRCKEVEEDRRTIWMSCFYDMSETGIPFSEEIEGNDAETPKKFFTLRVCKACRSDWMKILTVWFAFPNSTPKSCGSGIFIRELGTVIEITEEEWKKRSPGIEPVRFLGEK